VGAAGRDAAALAGEVSVGAVRRYGAAMFLVAIAYTAFGVVDQLVIYAFHGSAQAAHYIANWSLITMLHMPGLAAATIVAPRLAGGGAVQAALFTRWLRILMVAYVGMVAIAASLAAWLVPLALGAKYQASAGIFAGLALYALLLGLAPHITMAANFLGGARSRIRISAVTIGINLVLDLLLVPGMGVWGAVIGTTAAFSFYVGAHTRLTLQLLGVASNARALARRWAWPLACWLGAAAVAGIAARALRAVLDAPTGNVFAVLAAGAIASLLYGALLWGAHATGVLRTAGIGVADHGTNLDAAAVNEIFDANVDGHPIAPGDDDDEEVA
jgi:O-antigen/teichoic acid export membrane protein